MGIRAYLMKRVLIKWVAYELPAYELPAWSHGMSLVFYEVKFIWIYTLSRTKIWHNNSLEWKCKNLLEKLYAHDVEVTILLQYSAIKLFSN